MEDGEFFFDKTTKGLNGLGKRYASADATLEIAARVAGR